MKGSGIAGVWEVVAEGAPFEYHVMTFHTDGTMLQSNPDSGNRISSDSNGMGAWRADGARVRGAFVEFTVDRRDPESVSRGIVRFDVEVAGDTFTGSANATFYDLSGVPRGAPAAARLRGRRFDAFALFPEP
ncbi:hypothetical protein [Nocardia jinanensis]|uniref:Uncharacterized protein n=1 Tax=Nocardia jinanensis TaxID=382504 RepID=A0A917VVY1_9NOCA|nr:hypothetical protein [Nocardia jinanensis]GGL27666.1 hypothetical protein GCM10011588_48120 [Nocardia jinanensis]